jgi:hypothetical protein
MYQLRHRWEVKQRNGSDHMFRDFQMSYFHISAGNVSQEIIKKQVEEIIELKYILLFTIH